MLPVVVGDTNQFVTDLMVTDDSTTDDAETTDIICNITCNAQPYGLKISTDMMKLLTVAQ